MLTREPRPARRPADRVAYAAIRDRIVTGALPPGARLVAEDIAAELDISRTPVREAFRQLEAEALLVIRPNRGATVAAFSPDELLDLFEMRAALEGLAARRACERWTDEFGDQLHLGLRRLGRAAPADPAFLPLHDALHALIDRQAGGTRIAAETERLRAAVERHLRSYFAQHETAAGTREDHRLLVEALEHGTPPQAEAAMREHVMHTARQLVAACLTLPQDGMLF